MQRVQALVANHDRRDRSSPRGVHAGRRASTRRASAVVGAGLRGPLLARPSQGWALGGGGLGRAGGGGLHDSERRTPPSRWSPILLTLSAEKIRTRVQTCCILNDMTAGWVHDEEEPSSVPDVAFAAGPLHVASERGVGEVRGAWDRGLCAVAFRWFGGVRVGHGPEADAASQHRPQGERRWLLVRSVGVSRVRSAGSGAELSVGDPFGADAEHAGEREGGGGGDRGVVGADGSFGAPDRAEVAARLVGGGCGDSPEAAARRGAGEGSRSVSAAVVRVVWSGVRFESAASGGVRGGLSGAVEEGAGSRAEKGERRKNLWTRADEIAVLAGCRRGRWCMRVRTAVVR